MKASKDPMKDEQLKFFNRLYLLNVEDPDEDPPLEFDIQSAEKVIQDIDAALKQGYKLDPWEEKVLYKVVAKLAKAKYS
jgi:hypothetical protein